MGDGGFRGPRRVSDTSPRVRTVPSGLRHGKKQAQDTFHKAFCYAQTQEELVKKIKR